MYTLNHCIGERINEMHQLKKLDFVLIELYSSFMRTFSAGSKLSEQLAKKLQRVKIVKRYDDLKKIDRPCFYVNVDNGKIEQFNKEAMKFLRLKKFELRDKRFDQLFEPQVSLSILKEHSQTLSVEERAVVFFAKKSERNHPSESRGFESAYMTVEQKSINNRLFYVVMLEQKPFSVSTVDLLIESSSKKLVLTNRACIECPDSGTVLRLQELYEQSLKQTIESVKDKKASRFVLQHGSK